MCFWLLDSGTVPQEWQSGMEMVIKASGRCVQLELVMHWFNNAYTYAWFFKHVELHAAHEFL